MYHCATLPPCGLDRCLYPVFRLYIEYLNDATTEVYQGDWEQRWLATLDASWPQFGSNPKVSIRQVKARGSEPENMK